MAVWKIWFCFSSIFGATAVALGAFGAHALKSSLAPVHLNTFEVAVRYQMYHCLALMGVAFLSKFLDGSSLVFIAGLLFCLGSLLFSGSLYVVVFSGIRAVGMITPLGGICLILGWLSLFAAIVRYK